jgi:hypothetical protein
LALYPAKRQQQWTEGKGLNKTATTHLHDSSESTPAPDFPYN